VVSIKAEAGCALARPETPASAFAALSCMREERLGDQARSGCARGAFSARLKVMDGGAQSESRRSCRGRARARA
jgi:hypothetical protein